MTESRGANSKALAWWIGDVVHVGEPHRTTVDPAPPDRMRETLRVRLAELGVDPADLLFQYPGDQYRFDRLMHED